MEQLFLSSKNLASNAVLSTGTLDVNEALTRFKKGEFSKISINAPIPSPTLSLHWSEVRTPRFNVHFAKELVGTKLTSYKFQYLAGFTFNDKTIPCHDWHQTENPQNYEIFEATMADRPIHRNALEGIGACNGTWLLDFLVNADKIQADPNRNESLLWHITKEGFVELLLTAHYDKSTELQSFIFQKDFSQMKWQQQVFVRP